MRELPNLFEGFKIGFFENNPNRFGNLSNDEIENVFNHSIIEISNLKNQFEKCSKLNVLLFVGGLGVCISKDFFIKLLEFIDLDYEVFERFILLNNKKNYLKIQSLWFPALKFRTFYEANFFVENEIKQN
jgi:hypothetical protein